MCSQDSSFATMSKGFRPAPYCGCFDSRAPILWSMIRGCNCGEEEDHETEFKWEEASASNAVLTGDGERQVMFHPVYSAGTAVVRADRPLRTDRQYYWEVKMLSDVYGTDIMIGVGTEEVNVERCQHKFTSLLGEDAESYGLSYTGRVLHAGGVVSDTRGFCKGSLVGVAVDMWRGTLQFYINREPLGVLFHNLRARKRNLYPMLCSTAAQSSMRLTFAGSRPVSLFTESANSLAASSHSGLRLPPGLWHKLGGHMWMPFPGERRLISDREKTDDMEMLEVTPALISNVLQTQYMNGYYVDSVDREFRLVVRE